MHINNSRQCAIQEINALAVPVTNMEAIELALSISRTIDFFLSRKTFAKGYMALNEAGAECDPLSSQAREFCVVGAFLCVSRPDSAVYQKWIQIINHAARTVVADPDYDVFKFNDEYAEKIEDIILILNLAIIATLQKCFDNTSQ